MQILPTATYGIWDNDSDLIYMVFTIIGISLGLLPTALIALPIGIIATILISIFFDKTVFKYYRDKKSDPVILIVVSIGVMFILNAIVRIIIGPGDVTFMDGARFIIKANEFKNLTGLNEGLAIKSTQLITVITTIITCSLLFYFLNKTKTGKSMRAYSNNEDLALLSGIDPGKIIIHLGYCLNISNDRWNPLRT